MDTQSVNAGSLSTTKFSLHQRPSMLLRRLVHINLASPCNLSDIRRWSAHQGCIGPQTSQQGVQRAGGCGELAQQVTANLQREV